MFTVLSITNGQKLYENYGEYSLILRVIETIQIIFLIVRHRDCPDSGHHMPIQPSPQPDG